MNALVAPTVLTTTVSGINMPIVDEVIEVVKTVIDLFTIFPLNVFLAASVIGVGITIFSSLRNSA